MFFLFFLFLFHWKFETPGFRLQILDNVIIAEYVTSRDYAARYYIGSDLIVFSLVGWVVGYARLRLC